MTLPESLQHILQLTLSFVRRRKPERVIASKQSITTPLGYVPYRRRVNVDVSLQDGIARARTREYAVKRKRTQK